MLQCLQGALASDQRVCLTEQIFEFEFTFLSPAFQLGPRKKQPDAGIRPIPSDLPSIVLEVGDSESLTQLKVDARLWLEHMPEVS